MKNAPRYLAAFVLPIVFAALLTRADGGCDGVVVEAPAEASASKRSVPVWFVGGQSNAMGGGDCIDDEAGAGHLAYRHDTRWKVYTETWGPSRADSRGCVGVHTGALSALSGPAFGSGAVISCARGGLSMRRERWRYWADCQAFIDEQLARMPGAYLAGVLWVHGEKDSGEVNSYRGYDVRFEQLRAAIEDDHGPVLWSVALLHPRDHGAVGTEHQARIAYMRAEMTALCEAEARMRCQETAALVLQDDGLHYTPEALRTLGAALRRLWQ